jgi:hypothetical protein
MDTIPPHTDETFPGNFSKINTPLRHVSAVLVDPHPPRQHTTDETGYVNFGSGVSVSNSKITLFLESPYRDIGTGISNPVQIDGNTREVRGRLVYVHSPNSMDPDSITYDPMDDSYRVLLEFVDSSHQPSSLPMDGTVDGIYKMEVVPVDNAGNSLADGASGGYNMDGLTPETMPDELRQEYYFLLDTVAPSMSLQSNGAGELTEIKVSGRQFSITGKTRDLSAKTGEEALKGGAGIDRVEYEVVFLNEDGSLVVSDTGKANPILSGQIAELSPITDKAKDPSVSSTQPMSISTYPEIELEERSFVINGMLPPLDQVITNSDPNSNYFLRVYSYDQAGNYTRKNVKMVLRYGEDSGFGSLSAPVLSSPAHGSSTGRVVVELKWQPVLEADSYLLSVSHPSGELTTHRVNINEDISKPIVHLDIFSREGDYVWWVNSEDSVGNRGVDSTHREFTIDKTPPAVSQVIWTDMSPESNGILTKGEFKLNVAFSEALSKFPEVSFTPPSSSISIQTVVTASYEGKNWEGLLTIPDTATDTWDGMAVLTIQGAVDKAGNIMAVNRKNQFEIDTGPDYDFSYFQNPVQNDEIICFIKASEALMATPVVFEPQGITFLNSNFSKIKDKIYSGVFRLNSTLAKVGSFEVTGKDLQGNPATRKVTFPVEMVSSSSGGSLKNSKLSVRIPKGGVEKETSLALLSNSWIYEGNDSEVLKSVQTLPSSVETVTPLGFIYPSVSFSKAVSLSVNGVSSCAQCGVFISSPSGTEFLGKLSEAQYQLSHTGSIFVGKDAEYPQILLEQQEADSRNFSLEFSVSDRISGVNASTLKVLVDHRELDCEGQGDSLYKCGGVSLEPGDLSVDISVEDGVGNKAVMSSSIVALGPLDMTMMVFPNPARSFSVFQYELSRPADEVSLKIYDAAGHQVFSRLSSEDVELGLTRGVHRFRWYLESDYGSEVANGVYFCELKVSSQNERLKKRVKLAILR